MNKLIPTICLLAFLVPLAYGQSISTNYSSRFLKRIENNYYDNVIVQLKDGRITGRYNIDSKSVIEKLFFGDFNAPVEYFVDPSFRPIIGFRIYRDSLNTTYLLEVKSKERTSDSIVSYSVLISDNFTDNIYTTVVNTIKTYTVTENPPVILDGDMITFRCIVGAEVWTFTIHEPYGNVKKISDLFRAMIADVEAGRFDEAKYLDLLD